MSTRAAAAFLLCVAGSSLHARPASAAPPAPRSLERADDWTAIDPVTRELVRVDPRPAAFHVPDLRAGHALTPSPSPSSATMSLAEGYTACFSTNDGWPFDLTSLAVAPRINLSPEGNYPYDAAMNPAETEVWHLAAGGDHVLVIDRATNAITERIPVGQYPVGIAFSWDGALAFVSSRDDLRVDVIDTATYQVIRSLPMPSTPSSQEPGKLAVDPVTHLVYLAEWYGPRVYELAADASSILRTATLGDSHWAIAVSPDGAHVYVTERDPLLNLVRDIDRASLTEIRTVAVPLDPWGLDVTRDGTKLVVCCEDAPALAVVDVASFTAVTIPMTVTDGPQDLDIHDTSGRAFVAAGRAASMGVVYVVDIASATVATTFPVAGYKTSVMTVQATLAPPGCPAVLPQVARLVASKQAANVSLSWTALPAARDGYNLWRVASKRSLPIVTSPPGPGVVGVCALVTSPGCSDGGATAGPPGTTFYYQVKAVCSGVEGP